MFPVYQAPRQFIPDADPTSHFDAFEFGNPVTTRVEAVIAARKWGISLHMKFPDEPTVIFVEQMSYREAKLRTEKPGTPYYDPNPPDAMVWLVVFEGDYALTLPGGAVSPLRSGCEHVIVNAADGMPKESGAHSCDGYDLSSQGR